ncbi:hypothetical protein PCANC_07994 [Puccinia coronata f. sp. avenae]|uniref:Phosphatidylethanolamine-binding protein n=1 Tax=Puccinia coronata f. sp. avenae TaxID=200324 RepID=A0A2N5UGX5_9BASI|nr:hypothetical protein PCANC_07994 [Puccinia coronata f. sp. avenae]PLW20788.1 hypothetical protein PCASD_13586 [Puccinia coronata f. sp. avenae]PLW36946.1 hypothetical protein PCASD_06645 [Puccinia coronata f. sp. avenae]
MYVFALCVGVASSCFGLASSHHTFNDDAALSRFKNGFEQAGLVPDLLPAFNPQGTLNIHLSDGKVLHHPGLSILTRDIQVCPEFQLYPGRTGQLNPADTLTLMMLDPDSPTHSNPSGAKLHLLATAIALDRYPDPVENYKLVNRTRFVVDWLPPAPGPQTGIHRYAFLLYKGVPSQESVQPFQDAAFNRSGFNLTQFTRTAGIQDPYAGTFLTIDSALPENVIKQNAQGNSASRPFIDAFTLSITTFLSLLGVTCFF